MSMIGEITLSIRGSFIQNTKLLNGSGATFRLLISKNSQIFFTSVQGRPERQFKGLKNCKATEEMLESF